MLKSSSKLVYVLHLLIGLSILSSCSYLEKRGSLLGKEDKEKNSAQMVPKKQFDELALKYAELLKKTEPVSSAVIKADVANITTSAEKSNEKEELKKSLVALNNEASLTETVDVFSKNLKKVKSNIDYTNNKAEIEPDYESLGSEIASLQKANQLLDSKKYDSALNVLKELEHSSHKQVRVRAKYSIGELLFRQSEFDLALQIFEEIVTKDAFSGIILKTLGRMIVCTEKLGQTGKRDKYYSILHDFFESKS